MEFLIVSFLMFVKFLPLILLLALIFYINHTLGVVISVFFLLAIVLIAIYGILKNRSADERYQQNLKKVAVYTLCVLVVVLTLVACVYVII